MERPELTITVQHSPAEAVVSLTGEIDLSTAPRLSTVVSELLSDPDPQVRGTAAYALGGIGSPAAIPALVRAL